MVKKPNTKLKSVHQRLSHKESRGANRHLNLKQQIASILLQLLTYSVLLIFSPFQPLKGEVIESLVAIVNDQIITQTDVEDFKHRLRSQFLIDGLLFFYTENPNQLIKNSRLLLDYMIDEKVLDIMIKEKGIKIPPSRIQGEIHRVLREQNVTKNQLKSFLKEKGFHLTQYEEFIEKSLKRTQFVQNEISSKVKISEEDISSYYLRNLSQNENLKNSQIFKFTLAHIFISKVQKTETNRKDSPRKRAWKIFNTLEYLSKNTFLNSEKPGPLASSQISFEQLVSQFSEEISPSPGGVIGSFTLNEMLPEFQSKVKKMKVNQVSKPIETKAGFHILKLVKKTLIEHPKIKKEKERIRNILLNERLNTQFKNWIKESRSKVFIHHVQASRLF